MKDIINPKILEYKGDSDFFRDGGIVAIPSYNPEDYEGWVVILREVGSDGLMPASPPSHS